MKPISASSFCNKYPLGTRGSGFVAIGKKRFITEDLYIIQSTHKTRNYSQPLITYNDNERVEQHGPLQSYIYKPVYKLLSKSCNFHIRTEEAKEQCLIAFDHSGIYSYKESLIQEYATDLMSMKQVGHSRKRGEFLIDAIYYKANPLVMNYRDGRLKSGFKNHLMRRAKGFAHNSFVTNEMLKALKANIHGVHEINLTTQDDMFTMSIADCVVEMQEYVSPMYPPITYCRFTDKIRLQNHLQSVSISGIRQYIDYGLDLGDAGLTYDDRSHTWLRENEIMIDGTCYDSTTVEITRCVECNSKCVVEETRGEKCVDCLDIDYRIQNYSHRVEETLGFDKHLKRKDEPYLGIEIEYQVEKRKAGRLYTGDHLAGHALMKDDGSISNGFEIVSRPASYTKHLINYESFLDGLPEWIHPHKSCGMHVHISRTGFTQLGAGKLTEFINRKDNKDFITLIAGRDRTNYQSGDSTYDLKKPYQISQDHGYAERYNYVNLNNRKTIELRMFASPKNLNEFKVRMQFVKAMISYCQPGVLTGTLREQTSFGSFVKWLDKSKKEFKELHKHIKESRICA